MKKEKVKLEDLPENIQNMILKNGYYIECDKINSPDDIYKDKLNFTIYQYDTMPYVSMTIKLDEKGNVTYE